MPAVKKPRKKSSEEESFRELANEEIALRGIEYANKKAAIKELEAQCKECRKPLEAYIDCEGRVLESGSKLAVLTHADVDVHLKKTLRTGKQLLPEAIDVLRENGFDECIEEIPTVREDVVERLYFEGKISDELLKALYQDKPSYAFSVEIKNRMSDAPE